MKAFLYMYIRISCVVVLLVACTAKPPVTYFSDDSSELLRPNLGYVQYIKNRSLLNISTSFATAVSGTMNIWSAPEVPYTEFAGMAQVWLAINPVLYLTDIGVPFFKGLEQGNILQMLKGMGIDGLYIRPMFGSGYLWTNTARLDLLNEDAVQLEFPPEMGSYEDFQAFRTILGQEQMFLGSSIFPVATGLGPDFWLATRSVAGYLGVYTLLPVPQKLWNILPEIQAGEHVRAVPEKALAILRKEKIIPPYISQDLFLHGEKTGWATTSEIVDSNGVTQRFLFRYFQHPEQPVMNWKDPSYATQRIINASILQSIGIQGMALLGIQVQPYFGLTVQETNTPSAVKDIDSLYLYALQGISRTVKQFGAWSFVENFLPIATLMNALQDVPFVLDSITAPSAEFALLTGDTTLLQLLLTEAIQYGVPFERLIHAMPSEKGIPLYPQSFYLANSMEYINTAIQKEHLRSIALIRKQYGKWEEKEAHTVENLPLTAPLLATLALGYTPDEKVQYDAKKQKDIIKAHTALLFFKAMQPGILLLSSQDISAPLPLTKERYQQTGNIWKPNLRNYGAYSFQVLPYTNILNRFGVPYTKSLYPELQTQDIAEYSFKKEVEKILSLRKELGIVNSRLIGNIPVKATSVATVLEQGKSGFIIVLSNFSTHKTEIMLDTSTVPALHTYIAGGVVYEVFPKSNKYISLKKTMTLEPFEWRVIKVTKKK